MTTPIAPAHSNHGFTLIETIIYLALFSIIIGGVLASTYYIVQSTTKTQQNAIVQEEINFILGKINWALTSANRQICQPTVGNSFDSLTLAENCASLAQPIIFTFDPDNHILSVLSDGVTTKSLNSASVDIENLLFTHSQETNQLSKLETSFDLTSKLTGKTQTVSSTKYLRH